MMTCATSLGEIITSSTCWMKVFLNSTVAFHKWEENFEEIANHTRPLAFLPFKQNQKLTERF